MTTFPLNLSIVKLIHKHYSRPGILQLQKNILNDNVADTYLSEEMTKLIKETRHINHNDKDINAPEMSMVERLRLMRKILLYLEVYMGKCYATDYYYLNTIILILLS